MNKQKIRIIDTGSIHELDSSCKWEVRNGVLWNLNTNHVEGVDDDIVEYQIKGIKYRGHVDKGHTCYQLIHTKEWGGVCIPANEYNVIFTHMSRVEIIQE